METTETPRQRTFTVSARTSPALDPEDDDAIGEHLARVPDYLTAYGAKDPAVVIDQDGCLCFTAQYEAEDAVSAMLQAQSGVAWLPIKDYTVEVEP